MGSLKIRKEIYMKEIIRISYRRVIARFVSVRKTTIKDKFLDLNLMEKEDYNFTKNNKYGKGNGETTNWYKISANEFYYFFIDYI